MEKGAKGQMLGPAKVIQRFWRGTRAALRITRWDNAATKIQQSYKIYKWNLRADAFLRATLRIQRTWLGAIHRKWLRHMHASAAFIQKIVRATQVRLVLNTEGREIARGYQQEMNLLIKEKQDMSETEYISRTATLAGKLRGNLARHREMNLDMRRMPLFSLSSTQAHQMDKAQRMSMKGSVQPMRISEFEPMVFALAKMEPKLPPRYGAQRSKVLHLVVESKKDLDKTLPRESIRRRPHAGAKRGRNAIVARRLAKKPKVAEFRGSGEDLNEDDLNQWSLQMFEFKRF